MIQLDLFNNETINPNEVRGRGRPSKISEDIVFAVINDIKKQEKDKKLTNKKNYKKAELIVKKCGIFRTFYHYLSYKNQPALV